MAEDLRTFLNQIDNQLLRVPAEVQAEHLSALINQAEQPVLFEKIAGHPGWSVCDLLFRDRKSQARVVGAEPDTLLTEIAARLKMPPRPVVHVADGPVKEERWQGDEVNLNRIPAFKHGSKDGGPAIIAMTICRDLETGRDNLAWTRITPLTERRGTYLIGSSPHMRSILAQYEAQNEPMPIAFVVGTHPAFEIMASYSVTTHLEEFGEMEMVAGFLGEDVEVVDCDSIDLQVPAHAELVIEGHVLPGERASDGPGPSQALYYLPGVSEQPVFEVSAITSRKNPILRQINTLLFTDHQTLISLPHEAILFDRLREHGAKVHDVYFVPWGGTLSCVVKMTPEYDGQVTDILMFVLGSRWPNAKMVIAVDDDVEIESAEDIIWCLSTRVDPAKDVIVIDNAKGHPIDPTGRPVEGLPRARVVSKWGINATKPPQSSAGARATFEKTWPDKWGEVDLEDFLK
jgi:2,5-furandicarboxylate decarboxylase 1